MLVSPGVVGCELLLYTNAVCLNVLEASLLLAGAPVRHTLDVGAVLLFLQSQSLRISFWCISTLTVSAAGAAGREEVPQAEPAGEGGHKPALLWLVQVSIRTSNQVLSCQLTSFLLRS